jgi:cytochrome b
MTSEPDAGRIAVWDWPVRIVHWSLVPLIVFSWWSAEEGELDWHMRSGLVILGLLIFRLLWGVVGSSTARFSQFVRGPSTIRAFVGGRYQPGVGHNPLGALSVVALLLALGIQLGLGLIATDTDTGLDSGPLSHLVSNATSKWAGEIHHDFFNIIVGLIGLHLAAIAWYLVKRDNLILPMLRGWRYGEGEGLRHAPAWRALAAMAVALALVWAIYDGFRFLV